MSNHETTIRRMTKCGFKACIKLPSRMAMVVITFLIALMPFGVNAGSLDSHTRLLLQVSLKTYIENKSADGSYPFFDPEKGEPQILELKNLHPMIFQKDDYYLMCADFVKGDGEAVLIDYIVRKHRDGFRVEQEIRGRRSYLTKVFDRVF